MIRFSSTDKETGQGFCQLQMAFLFVLAPSKTISGSEAEKIIFVSNKPKPIKYVEETRFILRIPKLQSQDEERGSQI
jgi:hypothetical protein